MAADVLMTKGVKRTSGRSSNTKGSDNIISNGSVIAVNEGQAIMIVDQGAIVEFTAEPGEFTWDASTEPSIFYGGLGEGLKNSWNTLKRRFTFGADTGKDQRVYFFNLKEIMGNKYGTPAPVPFRVVDHNIGLDIDVSVRCNGEYSYKITDPMLFYKNVAANVTDSFYRNQIDSQLKSDFLTHLQPAFAKISAMGIRYSALPGHTVELADAMNDVMTSKWADLRGISIVTVGVNSVTIPAEDEAMIKELQKTAVYRNVNMAAAATVSAQADAMRAAAKNEGGAMLGFMGMNMAQQTGGVNSAQLFQMAQQQPAAPAAPTAPAAPAGGWKCSCGAMATGKFCPECGSKKPEAKPANGWKCSCGNVATGKFCPECGAKQPAEGWTCSCGAVNKGKFCPECGSKKPAAEPLYRCDKCGWEPADPKNPPRFCPECGDPFNDADIK